MRYIALLKNTSQLTVTIIVQNTIHTGLFTSNYSHRTIHIGQFTSEMS